ncbi:DUF4910 domain-containing protein [Candidatus Bipolaricaulota bacterium]
MKLDALFSFLAEEFSGLRAKNTVAAIAGFHRIQASPEYDAAVRYVASELKGLGIDYTVSKFAADGKAEIFGWIAPPGWTIRSGSLTQIEPKTKCLGSYDVVKQSILGQSAAGNAEGEVIHVGKGDSEACFDGLDLKSKFLLTSGRPASMLKSLKDKGVSGIILYPDGERAAPSYDLIQYGGLFPKANELDWLPMGFSISRRDADGLLKDLEKGAVCVRGEMDAEFIDNPMQVLEASISGSDTDVSEVLLVAHLCHPAQSANDNASGSGVLVEIARVLAKLADRGELANTVRLVWVPEFNGAIPWAAANAENLSNVLFSINLDMVGQSPELIGEPLRVFRVPNSHPVFLNACFEPLLATIASDQRLLAVQGSRRVLHWILDVPSGGSDHLVFQAPPVDVPSAMLGHDDPYWHTDLDTIEKVDPTRLKSVGVLTAILSLLPTWGHDESQLLAEWLLGFGHRELIHAGTLARSVEGAMKKLLLETALTIEEARIASLADFLGVNRWEGGAHLESLQATYQALTQSPDEGGEAGETGTYDAKPMRILDGPVRYAAIQDLRKEDRDFLEEKLSSHHGAPPQVLANLADGTRTISEITAHLSLDFQRLYTMADIARAVNLLEEVGYLDTKS